MEITSVNNEKVKYLVKLGQKKYRDKEGLYIVEGIHLVEEALKNDLVSEIYSTDNYPNSIKVSNEVMKKISSLDTPSKVLAVVKKKNNVEISGNVLILDNIQDPGNLGTIIRSAIAFNINTIIASLNTVDVYNSKVLRATEGMFFKINYIIDDLDKRINELKNNNYTIYTTNVSNGDKLSNIKVNKPYGIIVGNEGNGVRREITSKCDKNLYIKLNSDVESLNVGVACSILLYELDRNE